MVPRASFKIKICPRHKPFRDVHTIWVICFIVCSIVCKDSVEFLSKLNIFNPFGSSSKLCPFIWAYPNDFSDWNSAILICQSVPRMIGKTVSRTIPTRYGFKTLNYVFKSEFHRPYRPVSDSRLQTKNRVFEHMTIILFIFLVICECLVWEIHHNWHF